MVIFLVIILGSQDKIRQKRFFFKSTGKAGRTRLKATANSIKIYLFVVNILGSHDNHPSAGDTF